MASFNWGVCCIIWEKMPRLKPVSLEVGTCLDIDKIALVQECQQVWFIIHSNASLELNFTPSYAGSYSMRWWYCQMQRDGVVPKGIRENWRVDKSQVRWLSTYRNLGNCWGCKSWERVDLRHRVCLWRLDRSSILGSVSLFNKVVLDLWPAFASCILRMRVVA